MSAPRIELAPGYAIARIVNGCWQLAEGHRPGERARAEGAVTGGLLRLIDAGYTTFDCADIYTGVETLLGKVVAAHRERGADRAELQVHTKLVPDRSALATLSRRYVERVVDRSLARLGVERLDLVQLHWWDYDVPGWLDAARWLDEQRAAGKVRLLGVTNFDVPRLRAIVEDAGVKIASHQLQYSLLDRRAERGMVAWCRRHGIRLLAYGTLAGGFLRGRWLAAPAPAGALANRSLVKYRLIIDECGGWPAFQRLLDALAAIARRHRSDIAAVATRWVLDRPGVAAAIVGTRDDRHLEDRRALLALELDAEDLGRIDAVLDDLPPPPGDVYELERRDGGPHAAIMRTELNRAGSAPEPPA